MGEAGGHVVVGGGEGTARNPAPAPGGPSKVGVAIGLLGQAQPLGLQPAYIPADSRYAAAQIRNLLGSWGGGLKCASGVTASSKSRAHSDVVPSLWAESGEIVRRRALSLVKDGRRDWGTNALTLTSRDVKAPYSHRQQLAATFRLLEQELGWGTCSCPKHQAHWAHLHLGV